MRTATAATLAAMALVACTACGSDEEGYGIDAGATYVALGDSYTAAGGVPEVGVRDRAPDARIVMVGYPQLVPAEGQCDLLPAVAELIVEALED